MSSTKIINVLKDDKFEELLDIVKDTDASEVVFVLPKQARAFKTEGHFVVLADEAKDSSKSISFLCSNPEVNELAKKYKFDVLSTKTESAKSKAVKPKSEPIKSAPIAVPVIAKDDDDLDEEDEEAEEANEPASVEDYGEAKEEKEYKEEEEEPDVAEEEPPYGTELDESGNPIYDEEKNIGEEITSKTPSADFQILTASSRRSMGDVVKPSEGKHVKVAKIDKRPKSQELGTQLKVTMSANFSSVDNSFNRIPGQLFTISKSASDEFSATAEKDAVQKSRGTITIYNEYSTSPQPLVATTRFEYIQGGKESRCCTHYIWL